MNGGIGMTGGQSDKDRQSKALTWIVLAAALLCFAVLLAGVSAGTPYAFDTRILLAFRDTADLALPRGPVWLRGAMRDITGLGSGAVLSIVTTAAIACLLLLRRAQKALFVFSTVVSGQILSSALKLAVDRARPDVVPHLADVSTLSFPSGHAMMSTVTYLAIALVTPPRLRGFSVGLAIFLAALIGVSRLYLGVHWPSDVMAGWCAGIAWVSMCFLIAMAFSPQARESR